VDSESGGEKIKKFKNSGMYVVPLQVFPKRETVKNYLLYQKTVIESQALTPVPESRRN